MNALPAGLREFLIQADWGEAVVEPVPGDASFRRYFRVSSASDRAMLMHAPPPHEDPRPFLDVGAWLIDQGLRAPLIYAADPQTGWVLLEDFGDDRMRDWLDIHPDGERAAYERAIETLCALHQKSPGPFPHYDVDAYLREAQLLIDWYCPAMGLEVDGPGFVEAWRQVLAPLESRQSPGVTVLRDYHAENIMLLGDPRHGGEQGIIDFQDALVGHPAYDLVSLLQDARRDVSGELERAMLAHYQSLADAGPDFEADYALLGAQRNAKIVGIFTRLNTRDGKPRYLDLIPRVWRLMERDLLHPALGPVAQWFDTNIPQAVREQHGGRPV